MTTNQPPERIWLQLNGDSDPKVEGWADPQSGEVTWCLEPIWEHDVEYIRADLAAQEPTP